MPAYIISPQASIIVTNNLCTSFNLNLPLVSFVPGFYKVPLQVATSSCIIGFLNECTKMKCKLFLSNATSIIKGNSLCLCFGLAEGKREGVQPGVHVPPALLCREGVQRQHAGHSPLPGTSQTNSSPKLKCHI